MNTFQIYSDGSFNHQSKRGAITCLILQNNLVLGKAWNNGVFNNSIEVELKAILMALKELPENCKSIVFTDCSAIPIYFEKIKDPSFIKDLYKNPKLISFEPYFKELYKYMQTITIEIVWTSRTHPLIRWCHNCCHNKNKYWKMLTVDETLINLDNLPEEKAKPSIPLMKKPNIKNIKSRVAFFKKYHDYIL